jgi:hypothetical protein
VQSQASYSQLTFGDLRVFAPPVNFPSSSFIFVEVEPPEVERARRRGDPEFNGPL